MSPRACVHGFFEVSYLPVENPNDEYMYFSKVHCKLLGKLKLFSKVLMPIRVLQQCVKLPVALYLC